MSKKIEVELPCPSCQQAQHLQLPTSVDLGEEPGEQYAILTDSLFTHTCAHCGARFQVAHELLVIHKDAGYALFLVPGGDAREVDAPQSLTALNLRLVSDVNELKEKVLAFEGLLDDRTLELCKLYLSLRQDPGETDYTLLFTEHRDGNLSFSKMDKEGKAGEILQVPDSLYLELDAKGKAMQTTPGKFQKVDMSWALEQIATKR